MTDDNAEAARQHIKKRRKIEPKAKAPDPDADVHFDRVFVQPLPEDCPVIPLGHANGVNYFIDKAGQLRDLTDEKMGRLKLINLFGDASFLYRHWPRKDANGFVTGWRPEQVCETLTRACLERGVIDVAETVRGRGAWKGPRGELIMHCGDVIVFGDPPDDDRVPGKVTAYEPGHIDGYVYPRAAALPRPFHERVPEAPGPNGSPADQLFKHLQSWHWARGDMDARLLLGWIAAAMIGGALEWRPLVWITGGRGTGKSTLHALLRALFDTALISVSDTSAAGVWQKLKHQTLPVAIDELEAEEDPRKAQNVIKVARQAASGGIILRGGANHEGAEFQARACFLFSSILIPPLQGQDRSRMAILELRDLRRDGAGKTVPMPVLRPDVAALIGTKLRRRMFDQWSRFASIYETYRSELAQHGHSARGCDQFGTLLACADLALHDMEPSDRPGNSVAALAERLKVQTLAEAADDMTDELAMLTHLTSQRIDPWNDGRRHGLGEWIAKAAKPPPAPHLVPAEQMEEADDAHSAIQRVGLKIHELEGRRWLAIANTHAELARLFLGTHWAGRSGAGAGAWVQAARRLQGAIPGPPVWFASIGRTVRATLVPIELVVTPAPAPAPTPAPVVDPSAQQG